MKQEHIQNHPNRKSSNDPNRTAGSQSENKNENAADSGTGRGNAAGRGAEFRILQRDATTPAWQLQEIYKICQRIKHKPNIKLQKLLKADGFQANKLATKTKSDTNHYNYPMFSPSIQFFHKLTHHHPLHHSETNSNAYYHVTQHGVVDFSYLK